MGFVIILWGTPIRTVISAMGRITPIKWSGCSGIGIIYFVRYGVRSVDSYEYAWVNNMNKAT